MFRFKQRGRSKRTGEATCCNCNRDIQVTEDVTCDDCVSQIEEYQYDKGFQDGSDNASASW